MQQSHQNIHSEVWIAQRRLVDVHHPTRTDPESSLLVPALSATAVTKQQTSLDPLIRHLPSGPGVAQSAIESAGQLQDSRRQTAGHGTQAGLVPPHGPERLPAEPADICEWGSSEPCTHKRPACGSRQGCWINTVPGGSRQGCQAAPAAEGRTQGAARQYCQQWSGVPGIPTLQGRPAGEVV